MAIRTLTAEHVAQALVELAEEDALRPAVLDATELEGNWETWLRTLFARYVSDANGVPVPFGSHHRDFWDWVWRIRLGIYQNPFVGVWARGGAKSTSGELAVVSMAARRVRRYGLYVCETQDRADDHVSNVGGMLENNEFGQAYPSVAARMVTKYGHSKGWRRNRLRTASGFTLDSIGLDTASRGAKLDEARPDFMVLDDIDDKLDTPLTTSKKEQVISHSLLPAGSADCITLAIQNMILPDGVFARLCRKGDSGADFLLDRIVSGPHPALHGFAYKQFTDPDGRMRYLIEAGRPTWEGQNLERCQAMVNRMGLAAFLNECQHEVEAPPGGMYDDIHFRHCRLEEVPDLVCVEAWVDPAVTETDDSDCHGVQVDGLAKNGTIYRLFSWEQRASPDRAIEMAVLQCCAHKGQLVGVETNQGGDLWRDKFNEVVKRLRTDGRIDYAPAFASEKAGAGDGPKVHRQSLQLGAYETGAFVHVLDKHESYEVLERALKRFPKTAPLDLADASYWSWRSLNRKISRLGVVAVGGNTRSSPWSFGGGEDDDD